MLRSSCLVASAILLASFVPAHGLARGAQVQEDRQGDAKSMRVEPGGDSTPGYVGSVSLTPQTYMDPQNRFSFTAPIRWGRLPGSGADEVTFQSDSGDNMRVTIAPLRVTPKAFLDAYVDTYLGVLGQTFTDVKFVGQRPVAVGNRQATDYIFTGYFHSTPVLCHQIIVLTAGNVVYITFAGFGANREMAEQFFLSAVLTFWIDPAFAGQASVALEGPPFSFPLPDGWTEQSTSKDGSRTYRPGTARNTSPLIRVFTYKQPPDAPAEVNPAFVQTNAERIRGMFRPGMCEIQRSTSSRLGEAPAVRFDLTYVSDEGGLRRVILVLGIRDGYVVGLSCDAADSGFNIHQPGFENAITGFKFLPPSGG
jgi:hypothetical protein